MANKVLIRRSATTGAVPTTAQLSLGELAINTFDGKLFIKKNNGADSIVEIGGNAALAHNIRVFTASGSYTPSTGTKAILVYLTGGGGAGGSVQSSTVAGNIYLAGSGAAGNTLIFTMLATPASTYTITIGGGGTTTPSGTSTAGIPGAAGTASSFALGATIIATAAGGPGGNAGTPGGTPVNGQPAAITAPNATYVSATSYIGLRGGAGNTSFAVATGSNQAANGNAHSGQGGASFWGQGGAMFSAGATLTPFVGGGAALVYGAGGGGAAKLGKNTTTSSITGGAGFNGVCMIVELKG